MTTIRPFLKWAGGKFRLLDKLLPLLPEGSTLIEPCVGSGAVFLNSHYPRFVLNDTNADLIALYQLVQQDVGYVISETRSLFKPRYNQKKMYYSLRDTFNESHDPTERAILFLYLNRHGYNGLCRYNQKGRFNVPFGSYKNPYFPEKELNYFAEKSQNAKFTCQDFRMVMKKARKKQVIYCDPPYVPLSNTAYFTQYHGSGFTIDDQTDLAELANDLTQRGVKTIISNHDTKLTRQLYKGAKLHAFELRRQISCDTHNRQKAKELIACFYPYNTFVT